MAAIATSWSLRVSNACLALLYLVRNLYRTEFLLLLNVSLSLVLRLRFCLLTEVDDIVGGVADVADVDVHQIQTELAQLGVDIILHLGEELVAVGVEFLDIYIFFPKEIFLKSLRAFDYKNLVP